MVQEKWSGPCIPNINEKVQELSRPVSVCQIHPEKDHKKNYFCTTETGFVYTQHGVHVAWNSTWHKTRHSTDEHNQKMFI
jgi:hypothetical protein